MAGALWVSERANPFFVLQRRRGHGRGGGLSGEFGPCHGPVLWVQSEGFGLVLYGSGTFRF